MKDIVIKEKHIKRELYCLLACFVAAFAVNTGAVIAYDRPWIELVSQLGYVVFVTVVIYVLLLIFRLLAALVIRLLGRNR